MTPPEQILSNIISKINVPMIGSNTKYFGRGYSVDNLEKIRSFYITYSIPQTVPAQLKLSWSHYLVLIRVNNINERNFYEIESISNNWSLSELLGQIKPCTPSQQPLLFNFIVVFLLYACITMF